jgi:secretion/DNA translocation related TadE-like protein
VILGERGVASMMMAGVMGVVVTMGCVAMVICGYLLGYHRARSAADLAALSGAVAYQQGRDGCAEARRLAAANGARLAGCDEVGDQVDFVITARVSVAARLAVPGLPRTITAEAHAGPVAQPGSAEVASRPSVGGTVPRPRSPKTKPRT